jgi:hypothetical protein
MNYRIAITNSEGKMIAGSPISADDVIRFLAELLPIGEEDTATGPVKTGRRPRLCGACSQPGHTVQTCPEEKKRLARLAEEDDEDDDDEEEEEEDRAKKKFDDTLRAVARIPREEEKDEEEKKEDEPLTEDQFDQVKYEKANGTLVSKDLAWEMEVPLKEVNIALFSGDYEGYLKRRSRD